MTFADISIRAATTAARILGETVTWPGGAANAGRAIIEQRQEMRIYETDVSEPTWTAKFLRSDYSSATRGGIVTRANGQRFALGELTDGATETWDAWTLQPLPVTE